MVIRFAVKEIYLYSSLSSLYLARILLTRRCTELLYHRFCPVALKCHLTVYDVAYVCHFFPPYLIILYLFYSSTKSSPRLRVMYNSRCNSSVNPKYRLVVDMLLWFSSSCIMASTSASCLCASSTCRANVFRHVCVLMLPAMPSALCTSFSRFQNHWIVMGRLHPSLSRCLLANSGSCTAFAHNVLQ